MSNLDMLARIEAIGIVPAVRTTSAEDALFASEAVFTGGIPVVEITLTIPGAIDVIAQLVRSDGDVIVGAGSVFDVDSAQRCLDAGASFLTSTGLDPAIVAFAHAHHMPMIPGALTPTEIMMSKRAGAAFIKVFPCSSVGGPAYIRAMRGPFPDTRFIASGGVTQQTAADYIRAGANVLGIGHDLLPNDAVKARNLGWIHELARRFLGMVKHSRETSKHIQHHAD